MVLGLLLAVALPGAAVTPQAALQWLGDAKLETAQAIEIRSRTLELPGASLEIESGRLFPAARVEGRAHELVFVGKARFRYQPVDDLEAYQLDVLSGERVLDTGLTRAVLLLGDPARVGSLLSAAPTPAPAEEGATAQRTLQDWRAGPRKTIGADRALLRAALDDPPLLTYALAWCRTEELGDFYYRFDPTAPEQIELGRAVVEPPADVREREEDEDDDDDDEEPDRPPPGPIWVSTPLRGADGKAVPPLGVAEPAHYKIEATLTAPVVPPRAPHASSTPGSAKPPKPPKPPRQITLRGTATLELDVPAGQRVVPLQLHPRLTARSSAFLYRSGEYVLAVLERPTAAAGRLQLEIGFEGDAFAFLAGLVPVLRDTMLWHPHAGLLDRATYDVTLRWPSDVQVLAGGERAESGNADGLTWERRRLEHPSKAFGFELGHFDVVEEQVGHIALTVGFNRVPGPVAEPVRRQIVDVLKASLMFYEAKFGVLPLDTMTVVTMPRGFSQGFEGFLTLAHAMTRSSNPDSLGTTGIQSERVSTIAHEMAHQWWGHRMGWSGDRDQWLSEALADFCARRFTLLVSTNRTMQQERQAHAWRTALLRRTTSGLAVGDLGPVVLGVRLARSYSPAAYQAVVYDKGAVVFDMLARQLGEEPLLAMLGELARAVNNRVLDTATFLAALEHMSGRDLGPFADRFIYGTGIPEVTYDWHATPAAAGGWTIQGRATRAARAPWRLRARVGAGDGGQGWSIVREHFDPPAESWPDLVVPFQVAVAGAASTGSRTTRGFGGTLTLSGPVTTFTIPVEREPTEFWLDQRGEVLAQFVVASRATKGGLRRLAERALAAQEWDAAAADFRDALAAPVYEAQVVPETLTAEDLAHEALYQDVMIHLGVARLHVERGQAEAAQQELEAAERLLPRKSSFAAEQRHALQGRVDLMLGRYGAIHARLERYLFWRPAEIAEAMRQREQGRLDEDAEIALLFAIASLETGWTDHARQAVAWAERAGADADALRQRLP